MEWRGPGFRGVAGSGGSGLDSFESDSDYEDHFNVASVRMVEQRQIRHVANYRIVTTLKNKEQLEADAKEIHSVLGTGRFSGSTTVVCAVFEVKGGYLYVATVNDAMMAPNLRKRAEALGYTLIYGIQTHAEGNLLLYEHKHDKDARLLAFGCDKASCPECEDLLRNLSVAGLDITPRPHKADGSRAFTSKFYFRSRLRKPKGAQGPFVERVRGFIHCNYGEDGRKLPHTAEEEDSLEKEDFPEEEVLPEEESPEFMIIGIVGMKDGKIFYQCVNEDGVPCIFSNDELKKYYAMEYLDYLESLLKKNQSAE